MTTASDVYGLGAILYDLLTGVPPFRGSTVTETLRKVVEEEPNRPRSLNPKVDRDLETICLKCLDKDPQRRYASAEALAGDLNRWLTGEPIQSRPIGRVERLYKWARRKPSLAALVATVAFVLSVVAPGFLAYYWWNSAQLQRFRVEERLQKAKTERAEAVGVEALYASLTKEVTQSLDGLRRPGWRVNALRKVKEAAESTARSRDPGELRTLAARCLAGIELVHVREIAPSFGAHCAVFSPDSKYLALGQGKGVPWFSVRVYDVASGEWLCDHRVNHVGLMKTSGVRSLRFSPDGRWLAAGTRDGSIYVWEALRIYAVPIVLSAHKDAVNGLAFRGPSTLISAGDETLRIWDAATGADWKERAVFPLGSRVRRIGDEPRRCVPRLRRP